MKRIKRSEVTVYHCITRTVGGERLLDRGTKEVLRALVWKVAGFCGVEVLAYCLMDNHFHVLVRVPEAEEVSREEVLRRYRILYENSGIKGYPDAAVMEGIFASGDEETIEDWMARLTARMGDVSAFMRTLKHRVTVYYNQTHRRFGTLWAERFKSIVVEDCPAVLRTVAAYLDLNPVRAGLVADPAEYRWCSYAEAMAGHVEAGAGLARAVGKREWAEAAPSYRVILFGKGGRVQRSGQASIPWERVKAVLEAGGKVEAHELLRCKVRYFGEGAIIGSQAFVERVGASALLGREVPSELEAGGGGDRDCSVEVGASALRSRLGKWLGVIPVLVGMEFTTWHHLRRQAVRSPGEVVGEQT